MKFRLIAAAALSLCFVACTQEGPPGPAGPQGEPGPTGVAGAPGATGETGAAGMDGMNGAPGLVYRGEWESAATYALGDVVGYQGTSYVASAAVSANVAPPASPWSVLAAKGDQGLIGPVGPAGSVGPTGAQGPAGADGATGAQGPAGAIGATGAMGAIGPMGPMGPAGAIGATGAQGPAGATGATGAMGPMGPMGPVGPMGPAGPGVTFATGTQQGALALSTSAAFYPIASGVTVTAGQRALVTLHLGIGSLSGVHQAVAYGLCFSDGNTTEFFPGVAWQFDHTGPFVAQLTSIDLSRVVTFPNAGTFDVGTCGATLDPAHVAQFNDGVLEVVLF